jgi:N-acetylglucosaminyldiphosphoundecaprenol N-acetyl-beta-D-mannosaminyltransferase
MDSPSALAATGVAGRAETATPGDGVAPSRWPIGVLGVPFENVTKAEAVARIEGMIASGRPHHVVTANVDFLVRARRDVELRRILIEADLALCDGTPLLWASRWLGNPLPERVAGADVVPDLIRAAAARGHRIYLLGAGPSVAANAADRLRKEHPNLVIAGHYSPPFSDLLEMDFADISLRVRSARPDILLVSFGCPKQEKWIAKHHQRLGVPVLIGVGATLDFLSGRIRRAPAFMQSHGLEFLYRLAQEPRRLAGRYAGDFLHFIPAIARQCWRLRPPPGPAIPPSVVSSTRPPDWRDVRVNGDLCASVLGELRAFFTETLGTGEHCQLDLSGVRFIDSTGAALLLQWRRRLRAQGLRLVLFNPSPTVRSALDLLGLTDCFTVLDPGGRRRPPDGSMPGDESVIPPYPGGCTLAWQGEITAANAEWVWSLTMGHFSATERPPRRTHVVNLSRLAFIDSAGAEIMLRLHRRALENGRRIWFPQARPAIRNVLAHARLEHLLNHPGP